MGDPVFESKPFEDDFWPMDRVDRAEEEKSSRQQKDQEAGKRNRMWID